MCKKLITNPITGKFIRKSSQRVINSVIQNFEGKDNYDSKKNLTYKVKSEPLNLTDKEFFDLHHKEFLKELNKKN